MIRRRAIAFVLSLAVPALALSALAGCQDDVKKTETVKTQKEGPVEMVSPGEEVVE